MTFPQTEKEILTKIKNKIKHAVHYYKDFVLCQRKINFHGRFPIVNQYERFWPFFFTQF